MSPILIVTGCIMLVAALYGITNKAVNEINSLNDFELENAGFSRVGCITNHTLLDLFKYNTSITYIVKDKQGKLFLATLKCTGSNTVFICKLVPVDKMHTGLFR